MFVDVRNMKTSWRCTRWGLREAKSVCDRNCGGVAQLMPTSAG